MKTRKWAAVVGAVVLIAAIGVLATGAVLAQDNTPTPTPDQSPKAFGFGRGFGLRGGMPGAGGWCFGGGGWVESFDSLAKALNLTPTQLFEELHSGKTLDEIAKAQGVDLSEIQKAAEAERVEAMKKAIAQAVEDGKLTQEQADWLLQGLEKGFLGKGRGFGFGMDFGRGMRGGMHMRGFDKVEPAPTPAPGTSS